MSAPTREQLARVHYLRMKAHFDKRWADDNAFAEGQWPQDEKDWRQTDHGAPWGANVRMARWHLKLAHEIVAEVPA